MRGIGEEKRVGRDGHDSRKGLCLIVAAALALLGVGCVTQPEGLRGIVKASEQEDIPVPTSFEFDANSSYAFDPATTVSQGKFRSWHGYYRGHGQIGLIVPWYIAEMKKHGWQYKGLEDSQNKVHFEKGEESCTIHLYRELDPKIGGFVEIVKAEIHPLGPEHFTVEENMGHAQRASIQPASASSGRDQVQRATYREEADEADRVDAELLKPSTRDAKQAATGAEKKPSRSARGTEPLKEVDQVEEDTR